jgi:hypothetical protein
MAFAEPKSMVKLGMIEVQLFFAFSIRVDDDNLTGDSPR